MRWGESWPRASSRGITGGGTDAPTPPKPKEAKQGRRGFPDLGTLPTPAVGRVFQLNCNDWVIWGAK